MKLTKQEALAKIKELEEYIKQEDKPKRWRAAGVGEYYFIDSAGGICSALDMNEIWDNFRYKTRNYYQTEEQSQKALDKIEAKARVDAYIEKYNLRIPEEELNWCDNIQFKYCLVGICSSKNIDWDYFNTRYSGEMFDCIISAEACEQIIKDNKEDLELLLLKKL